VRRKGGGGREREEGERARERQRTKVFHAIILKSMRHGEKHIRNICKRKTLLHFTVGKNNTQKSEIYFNYKSCAGRK
jgi:hypothetical protein